MNLNHLKINTKILSKYLLILVIIAAVFTKDTAAASLEGPQTFPKQSVNVSASVLDSTLTIFGYSSPNAKVELESPTVYAQTYTDDKGYFEFKRLTIPKIYNELCVFSTDSSKRETTPVCLPPLSGIEYHNNIGPILLPPTISLNDHQIKASSDNAYSSGEAIPDSDIDVYLFQIEKNPSLIKPVEALSFPKIRTHSDSQGNWSFSLPTTYSSGYRIYTSVVYDQNLSPKSNTLVFRLPTFFSIYTIILTIIFFITLLLFIILVILFYSDSRPKSKHHHLQSVKQ